MTAPTEGRLQTISAVSATSVDDLDQTPFAQKGGPAKAELRPPPVSGQLLAFQPDGRGQGTIPGNGRHRFFIGVHRWRIVFLRNPHGVMRLQKSLLATDAHRCTQMNTDQDQPQVASHLQWSGAVRPFGKDGPAILEGLNEVLVA